MLLLRSVVDYLLQFQFTMDSSWLIGIFSEAPSIFYICWLSPRDLWICSTSFIASILGEGGLCGARNGRCFRERDGEVW